MSLAVPLLGSHFPVKECYDAIRRQNCNCEWTDSHPDHGNFLGRLARLKLLVVRWE